MRGARAARPQADSLRVARRSKYFPEAASKFTLRNFCRNRQLANDSVCGTKFVAGRLEHRTNGCEPAHRTGSTTRSPSHMLSAAAPLKLSS